MPYVRVILEIFVMNGLSQAAALVGMKAMIGVCSSGQKTSRR
ncbi:MAG: hypothetical protein QXU32_09215 [Nitrososphaerales archaeon]